MNNAYFENIVLILYLIILSLGIAHHVSNIGHAIRLKKKLKAYWVHSIWMLMMFITQTQMADYIRTFRNFDAWNNFNVLLILTSPLQMYIGVVLSFPDLSSDEHTIDLKYFYFKNNKALFIVLSIIPIKHSLDRMIFSMNFSFMLYDLFMTVSTACVLLLAFFKSEWLHKLFALVLLLLLISFTVLMYLQSYF